MFMVPVGHTIRAFFLDQSGDPDDFYVEYFLQPLFVPAERIHFSIGDRVQRPDGGQVWTLSNPTLVRDLHHSLRPIADYFFSHIHTPADVAQAAASLKKSTNPHVREAIAYSFAKGGDTTSATHELDALIQQLQASPLYDWQRDMLQRVQGFRGVLLADTAKAQEQLLRWEQETARHVELEQYV